MIRSADNQPFDDDGPAHRSPERLRELIGDVIDELDRSAEDEENVTATKYT